MVSKILQFLYKETHNLNQAAFLLGFFALLSQLLAFLRDRLLAHIFGASLELDIYYAAFRIPDFIFVTVASLVSLSVLVPFIIDKEKEGRDVERKFIDNIFSFFSIVIIVVSTLAFFLMPSLSAIIFKGFSGEALEKAVLLSRIMLISPIVLGLSNLFGSITQAYGRFTLYAIAPLLYNAGIIFGIILFAEKMGVLGVVIGVVLGATLHALVQVPFVISSGLFPRPTFRIDVPSIIKVARISLPRTLTLSMTNISMVFMVSMASLMTAGSIAVLSFSFNLQAVPLSVIGVSYSLAAFPTLTRKFRDNHIEEFLEQMASTTRLIIFWSLPVSALFIVLRAQIVRVILGSGSFDWQATRLTAAALALFALSTVLQSLLLMFMRGFYSAGLTRKPFIINLISTIFLILTTWGLVQYFYASEVFRTFLVNLLKVSDVDGTVVLMLPLGFSIATILNCLLSWVAFERQFRGFTMKVLRTFMESLIGAFVMGVVAYFGLNLFSETFNTEFLLGIFMQGFIAGLMGIVAGILTLTILKNKELTVIKNTIRQKFWRTKVIATDPEIV